MSCHESWELWQRMLYLARPVIRAKFKAHVLLTVIQSGLPGMQVATLQKEAADISKQIAEAARMLKFADPGKHTV